MLDPDRLNSIPVKTASTATMALIDTVQAWPPEVQVVALNRNQKK